MKQMGNCFGLCKSGKRWCGGASAVKDQKVSRVVKMDGKILEFTAPILVRDLLVDFSGSGVGVSKEALRHLPPTYELKLGKIYYLLPLPSSETAANPAGLSSMEDDTEKNSGIKRIKVVITKKQLQDLLSKKISVDDIISKPERKTSHDHPIESSACWKPKLESIPEGSE